MFGLKPLPVILATVAFYIVGFLWYGLIFQEIWMTEQGVTEEDAGSPLWMLGGFIITLMQVIGLGMILKWHNGSGVGDAVKAVGLLWLLFALPFVLYAYIYNPAHSFPLLLVDASHLLVGWIAAAVVLAAMK